jgi:hypothetical protein
LRKADFERAMALIIDSRNNGLLPLDFIGDDAPRAFINVEKLDAADPEDQAQRVANYVDKVHTQYDPMSLWEHQNNYVEMLVEKVGLKNLFEPVCAKYHVALGNTRGSWSISMRVDLLLRLASWQAEDKRCVLLYCGDHDVHGLRISRDIRSKLEDLLPAFRATYPEWEDFDLDEVHIERFGLNADFIRKNRLS